MAIEAKTPRWGTIAEAAAENGVSDKTIRRYVSSGLIRAERVGPKFLRVDLDSITINEPSSVVDHIERLVAAAPPLTPAQINRLTGLLTRPEPRVLRRHASVDEALIGGDA